jgi:hypothetical protein
LQEQRYCWLCKNWYHKECLQVAVGLSQDAYIKDTISAKEEFRGVPDAILAVAFQPTARGGSVHFTTGNIRIVNKARSLVSIQERQEAEVSDWMVSRLNSESRSDVLGHDWIDWLKFTFGMDKEGAYEPLVVGDQEYHSCPSCNTLFLI